MPLSKQKQAIADILTLQQISHEGNAISAHAITTLMTKAGHFPANNAPAAGSAAGLMTNAFREISGLHRFKKKGSLAFLYYYIPVQEQLFRKTDLAPVRKADDVRTVPLMIPAPAARPSIMKINATKENPFVIITRVDGTFAGVMRDNILYESLEQLIASLNGKILKS